MNWRLKDNEVSKRLIMFVPHFCFVSFRASFLEGTTSNTTLRDLTVLEHSEDKQLHKISQLVNCFSKHVANSSWFYSFGKDCN